jgi:uncharacterized membrane protein
MFPFVNDCFTAGAAVLKGNMENKTNNAKLNNTRLRTRLYLTSASILLAGIVSAVLIYVAAMNDSAGDSGYEVIGGFVYPAGGGYSKKYVHDLQLYGGNAAMLGDQFTRWFSGLWHGTSLSYTVAVIAFLLSFAVFVSANNVPTRSISGGENKRDKSA